MPPRTRTRSTPPAAAASPDLGPAKDTDIIDTGALPDADVPPHDPPADDAGDENAPDPEPTQEPEEPQGEFIGYGVRAISYPHGEFAVDPETGRIIGPLL